MTRRSGVVDHPSRRLLIALPDDYDRAREHYESLVPAVDLSAYDGASDWDDVVAVAKQQAPHGFMRYFSIDVSPTMALSGSTSRATEYLMGNHTIAERMFRHDAGVMLHAPLRTLLYAGPDGTVLAVDQPSLLFASYGDPAITAVGHHLDGLLARLIELLDGDVPAQLLDERIRRP
ncbi:DUF302 domain-containing protein [Mycolicibacterium neworleansense]|uniref:DUF302 domain-containing protein n=1 Tax=Mycolicibacterium neworleansense TaxID=146018 RepID=A0A0H5RHF7_9MYCO|nr:DUF302 domain-containing protein [Mycolicibacterium neworleansense]MCV7361973.1 DUF302 domain-containing protein [Mycolicibacterium neworleansense]CRZ13620.1 hypothetical protein BN2156_00457 [Mycolicibacterium neworleansense]